jgi:hypothetical protein
MARLSVVVAVEGDTASMGDGTGRGPCGLASMRATCRRVRGRLPYRQSGSAGTSATLT